MYQILLNIFIPPLAICRYGAAACCIYPVSGIWLGGLALLAYHFATAHHFNAMTEQGSLYGGVFLIIVAIVWTRLTLSKVEADTNPRQYQGNSICRRMIPSPQEPDPLEETIKASKES